MTRTMTKEQKAVKRAQLRETMLKDCRRKREGDKDICPMGGDCPSCTIYDSRIRAEILENYDISAGGIIISPGKFEGEMVYVPYFWQKAMEGCADRDDGKVYGFDITKEDRAMFPELETRFRTVKLYQREDGFVCEL